MSEREMEDGIDRIAGHALEWKRRAEKAEHCVSTVATMLAWLNVPPQETLERHLNALRERVEGTESDLRVSRAHAADLQGEIATLTRELEDYKLAASTEAHERRSGEPAAMPRAHGADKGLEALTPGAFANLRSLLRSLSEPSPAPAPEPTPEGFLDVDMAPTTRFLLCRTCGHVVIAEGGLAHASWHAGPTPPSSPTTAQAPLPGATGEGASR